MGVPEHIPKTKSEGQMAERCNRKIFVASYTQLSIILKL